MNNTSFSSVVQPSTVESLQAKAAEIAQRYQDKLQELSKEHRRERYIDWFVYGAEDEPLNKLIADEYAIRGEREPEEMSFEELHTIVGVHFDRLTIEEVAEFEKRLRQENSNLYFDDHFYSDELIQLRRQWSNEISDLISQAREEWSEKYGQIIWATPDMSKPMSEEEHNQLLQQHEEEQTQLRKQYEYEKIEISNIGHQYWPAAFSCDSCGNLTYSHDETGTLIAKVGLWTLSTGDIGNYLICEDCQDKPDETHEALSKLFADIEAHKEAHELELEKEIANAIHTPWNNPTDPQSTS